MRFLSRVVALAALACICSHLADGQILQFSGAPLPLTPSIVATRTSGTAPLSVLVDLTGTVDPSETSRPFHELYYTTTFGDSGSGNWSYGSSNSTLSCGGGAGGQQTYCTAMPTLSRNTDYGPVAAHVYDQCPSTYPCNFTITSTVRGPSGPVSATTTITVNDPATIWGGNWGTFSVQGSVSGTILTVASVNSGTVTPGGVIAGTGLSAVAPATIQPYGTGGTSGTGSTGTYALNVAPGNVGTETITGIYCNFGGVNSSPATSIGCTTCLSNTPSYTNCPTGARHDTSASVQASLGTYLGVGGQSNRIMWHAGETFNTTATASSTPTIACSSCEMDSYDTGAQPILGAQVKFSLGSVLNFPANGSDQRIRNVQIDGFSGADFGIAVGAGVTNLLIENVTFTNVTGMVNGTTPADFSNPTDGLFIVNSSGHSFTGGGTTCSGPEVNFFRGATRFAFYGNDVEDGESTNGGTFQLFRIQSWNKIAIGYNYIQRPCSQFNALTVRGDTRNTLATVARYANVHHNVVVGENDACGGGPLLQVAPQFVGAIEPISDVLVWDNYVVLGCGSQQGLELEASSVTLRTNIVQSIARTAAASASWVNGQSNGSVPTANIWQYANTFYCGTQGLAASNPDTNFANNTGSGKYTNYNITDELYYCANTTTPVMSGGANSPPPTVASSTTNPLTNPSFTNGGGSMFLTGDYALQAGSYAKGAGASVPGLYANFQNQLLNGIYNIGAQ